jgi:cytochrome c553
MVFTTPQSTADGVDLSCGSCHRQDGAGAAGPPVRGQSAEHLLEHAQGDGPHPEGIKYPDLVPQGFVDMEAFLADATHGHE